MFSKIDSYRRVLDNAGLSQLFENGQCHIMSKGTTLCIGNLRGQHYWLDLASSPSLHALGPSLSLELWHQHFGHLNYGALSHLPLSVSGGKPLHPCEGCAYGKFPQQSFPSSTTPRQSLPFKLVHSDLDGPMKVASIGSKCVYMATFVDDCTRASWVYYITHKSHLHKKFNDFRAYVNNQWNTEIKIFRSDRGGEYQSTDFIQKLTGLGIVHQTTISHSPQQNGLAERINRTLVGSAKSMLHAAGPGVLVAVL
jgi:hypothetical protein